MEGGCLDSIQQKNNRNNCNIDWGCDALIEPQNRCEEQSKEKIQFDRKQHEKSKIKLVDPSTRSRVKNLVMQIESQSNNAVNFLEIDNAMANADLRNVHQTRKFLLRLLQRRSKTQLRTGLSKWREFTWKSIMVNIHHSSYLQRIENEQHLSELQSIYIRQSRLLSMMAAELNEKKEIHVSLGTENAQLRKQLDHLKSCAFTIQEESLANDSNLKRIGQPTKRGLPFFTSFQGNSRTSSETSLGVAPTLISSQSDSSKTSYYPRRRRFSWSRIGTTMRNSLNSAEVVKSPLGDFENTLTEDSKGHRRSLSTPPVSDILEELKIRANFEMDSAPLRSRIDLTRSDGSNSPPLAVASATKIFPSNTWESPKTYSLPANVYTPQMEMEEAPRI